ncbi:hypothetical protein SAMN04487770_1202 [Butyrivibrio sp. ob235]|uniref:hypothetical protein n=1 Tax=Butyrivibrio sp. ob235 TaxID=1761780 RepID=UPI0008BC8B88|nr:hypothetical protein [Butyrivibrio sp. ob235]SEL88872.1 hypothetical protein SAMN04487770_1202 [Butyrivibrio sp. ob235]
MVVGLLGNESPDSNRFTLVTPKSENDVRLQATLANQNPTGLPVGIVSCATDKYFEKNRVQKAFANKKVKFEKKNGTVTIKKLKKGKKYYVGVRTYVVKDGKKYFSGWSEYTRKPIKVK